MDDTSTPEEQRVLEQWRRTAAGSIAIFYVAAITISSMATIVWTGPSGWTLKTVMGACGVSFLTTWNAVVLAAHAAIASRADDDPIIPAWVRTVDEYVLAPNVLMLTWITAYGVFFVYQALDDRGFRAILRFDTVIPEFAFAAGDWIMHVSTMMALLVLITTGRRRWAAWFSRHLQRVEAVYRWLLDHAGVTLRAIFDEIDILNGALWTACLIGGSCTLPIVYLFIINAAERYGFDATYGEDRGVWVVRLIILSTIGLFVPLFLGGVWGIMGTEAFGTRVALRMQGMPARADTEASRALGKRLVIAVRSAFSLVAAMVMAVTGMLACDPSSRQRYLMWLLCLAFIRFATLSTSQFVTSLQTLRPPEIPFHRHTDVQALWIPLCLGVVWASAFSEFAAWTIGDWFDIPSWRTWTDAAMLQGGTFFNFSLMHRGGGSLREFLINDRLSGVVGPAHVVCALFMYRAEFSGWLRDTAAFAERILPVRWRTHGLARLAVMHAASLWLVFAYAGLRLFDWTWADDARTWNYRSTVEGGFPRQRAVGFVVGVVATVAWQCILFQCVVDDDHFFARVVLIPVRDALHTVWRVIGERFRRPPSTATPTKQL